LSNKDINKYVKEETENYSSTALQTACASQSQEILKYLKKHGGDSKKKDSEGRSCKKIAKDNKAVWNLELIK
jgi:ankyrin repeat protein